MKYKVQKENLIHTVVISVFMAGTIFGLYFLRSSSLKNIVFEAQTKINPIVTHYYSKKKYEDLECKKDFSFGDVVIKRDVFATFKKNDTTEYIAPKENLFFLSKNCQQEVLKLGKKNISIYPIFKENKKYIGNFKDYAQIEAYFNDKLLYRFTTKIRHKNKSNLISVKTAPVITLKDTHVNKLTKLGIPLDAIKFKVSYCCVYDE